MEAPLVQQVGVGAPGETVIEMGEFEEVISPCLVPASSLRCGAQVDKPPATTEIPQALAYEVVPKSKSACHRLKSKIQVLTLLACSLWTVGIGLGFLGAPLAIEMGFELAAFALLGSGLALARS